MNENNQVPNQVPTTEPVQSVVAPPSNETIQPLEEKAPIEPPKEEKPKKKKRIGHLIGNIIFVVLLIIILAEAILGFVNMNSISDGKGPVFCFSEKTETKKNEKVTTYHLGLYKIVHTENKEKTQTTLKPFFLN